MFPLLVIIFRVLMALAMLMPAVASSIEGSCESHAVTSCHETIEIHEAGDSDFNSEAGCPIQHSCCRSPVYVLQNPVVLAVLEQDAEFGTGFFFAITSSVFESPFQPPEA
jgi:hypothetical protein